MLVWCGLQVTRGDHEDNVCVLHVKFLCSCVQTHEFFKNTRVELQNTCVLSHVCLKLELSCTVPPQSRSLLDIVLPIFEV